MAMSKTAKIIMWVSIGAGSLILVFVICGIAALISFKNTVREEIEMEADRMDEDSTIIFEESGQDYQEQEEEAEPAPEPDQ